MNHNFIIRVVAGLVGFLCVLMFLYGCSMMALAEDAPPPSNVEIVVPNATVRTIDANKRNTGLMIVGISTFAFLVSAGVFVWAFRRRLLA